jgi:hypothetical protein
MQTVLDFDSLLTLGSALPERPFANKRDDGHWPRLRGIAAGRRSDYCPFMCIISRICRSVKDFRKLFIILPAYALVKRRILSSRTKEACCPPEHMFASMAAYTSHEFQAVRLALLACSNADRAYLRRWILRWVDDRGAILPEAIPLPDQGC